MKTLWILGFSLLTASPVFAQQCYRPYTPSRVPIEIAPSATAPSLRLPLPTPPRTVPSPSDRNSAYNHARPPLVPISNRQQFLPQPAVSLRPTSTISDSHVTTYYPPAAAPRTYPLVPRIGYSQVGYLGSAPVTTVYQPVQSVPVATPYRFGRGLLGQPKVYVRGQPLRNALRFLSP